MRSNLRLAAFVFAALSAVAWWQNTPEPRPENWLFIAEHGNIASALVRGAGFAEAFGTPSGPTAWTPPVFPAVLAGLFWIFGIKTLAALRALLVLDALWAAATVWFLLAALDLAGRPRAKPWLVGTLLALIALHQAALGPWLTTAWFVAMLDAALLAAALGVWHGRGAGWRWLLTLVCGLLPLTHVGSGLAAAAIVLLLAVRAIRRDGARASLALIPPAVAGLLAVGGWTARNYAVFGQFIPLKSAGAFEVWLAEEQTPDGVLTDAVMIAHHPLAAPAVQADYTRLGERSFLAAYAPRARAALAAGPARWWRHVLARARNVFVYCDNTPSALSVKHATSPADAARLVQAGLAARTAGGGSLSWVSLGLTPAEFGRRVAAARLDDLTDLSVDWLGAQAYAARRAARPVAIASAWLLAGVPVVCLLLALALRRGAVELFLAGLIYVVALLPNVVVTHYLAHQLHFLGLQAFFLVSCGAALVDRARRSG